MNVKQDKKLHVGAWLGHRHTPDLQQQQHRNLFVDKPSQLPFTASLLPPSRASRHGMYLCCCCPCLTVNRLDTWLFGPLPWLPLLLWLPLMLNAGYCCCLLLTISAQHPTPLRRQHANCLAQTSMFHSYFDVRCYCFY
jgi:hypothetical protein